MSKGRRKRRRRIRWKRVFLLLSILFFLSAAIIGKLQKYEADASLAAAPVQTPDPVWKNSYDFSKLDTHEQLYRYEDDVYEAVPGIDVSFFQEEIDWQAVADAGIRFVMIRAGYRGSTSGMLHEDDAFRTNLDEAREAGLLVGVYWFSQAVNEREAVEEADYVLKLTEGEMLDLPVGYDMEYTGEKDRIRDLTAEEKTKIAAAFARRMKQKGHSTWIYGSTWWLENCIDMEDLQDLSSFWLAEYGVTEPGTVHAFDVWQYSADASINGIQHPVDVNLWFTGKQH